MKKIKVLFLGKNPKLPSTRIRVLNLIDVISSKGISCDFRPIPRKIWKRIKLFLSASNYDIVFLQKKTLSPGELLILRAKSKKLIFDFDDAIFTNSKTPFCSNPTREMKFRQVLKRSDLVITGNEYLRNQAIRHNKNVIIIPPAVPIKNIKYNTTTNQLPIIGWIGNKFTIRYLKIVEEALLSAYREINFELRIISDKPLHIPGIPCKFIRWSEETQEKEIAKFDIGINPLPDDPWTRGKCAYKVLQYMSMGKPFVASAVGMNTGLTFNNTTGFAAKSSHEFKQYILLLLRDRKLRQKMGAKGLEIVRNRFSTEVVGTKLAQVLKHTAKSKSRYHLHNILQAEYI